MELSLTEAATLVHRSPRQIQRVLAAGKVQYRKVWVQAEGQHLLRIDVNSLQSHYAPKEQAPKPLSMAQELAQLRAEVAQLRADLGAKRWMGR